MPENSYISSSLISKVTLLLFNICHHIYWWASWRQRNNARIHSFIHKYFINIVTVINLSIISREVIGHQTFQAKKDLFICLALITQVFRASANCSNYKTRIYYLSLCPVNRFYNQSLHWDLPNAKDYHFSSIVRGLIISYYHYTCSHNSVTQSLGVFGSYKKLWRNNLCFFCLYHLPHSSVMAVVDINTC